MFNTQIVDSFENIILQGNSWSRMPSTTVDINVSIKAEFFPVLCSPPYIQSSDVSSCVYFLYIWCEENRLCWPKRASFWDFYVDKSRQFETCVQSSFLQKLACSVGPTSNCLVIVLDRCEHCWSSLQQVTQIILHMPDTAPTSSNCAKLCRAGLVTANAKISCWISTLKMRVEWEVVWKLRKESIFLKMGWPNFGLMTPPTCHVFNYWFLDQTPGSVED